MKFSKDTNALSAWMLTACILLYPLLTYLAAPAVMTKPDGHRVVICTLNGLKTHYIGAGPVFDLEPQQDEHCPALQLVQLLGASTLPAPKTAPGTTVYLLGLVEQARVYLHHPRHVSVFPSRAPPIG